MPNDVVTLLEQLISIPSVNPMGGPDQGATFYEKALTDFLGHWFDRHGMNWETQPVAPRRENIVACLPGSIPPEQGGGVLALEAHQDTVPVTGMTVEPFHATLDGNRLYGRGACDIKGGMAAMLTAVARMAEHPGDERPTIIVACTVNEENGFTGSRALAEYWRAGQSTLVQRMPDAMVVAEPTELDVVVAHKGVVRWRCHSRGRAAHSSMPGQGTNAIYGMARVVHCLERYARQLCDGPKDPLLGAPTLNVGTIQGGICVNAVPDACQIEIDRRLLPGEDPLNAQRAVIAYLRDAGLAEPTVSHESPFLWSRGLENQSGTWLARRLEATVERHGGSGRLIGVPFGTDAPSFASSGLPTVVFGPGSIKQAHTVDEWIAVDQLRRSVEIFETLGREFPVRAAEIQ